MADQSSPWTIQVQEGVPSSEASPSKGPTYRSALAKDGYPTMEGISTVWDLFSKSAERFPDNNMLGKREIVDGKAGKYVWLTYAQVMEKTLQCSSALRHVGLSERGRVGVYGANCPEWVITMEACNSQTLYCVPLYDTLGAEAIQFIVKHAEVSLVVVQQAKIPALMASMEGCGDLVKTIVSMGEWDDASKGKAQALGIATHTWDEFLALGAANSAALAPPKPEDYCTIMYTSGTTGEPKGVLLTHAAVAQMVASLDKYTSVYAEKLGPSDVYLSYLPLAHIFDRTTEEFFIYLGGSIGFWQGDVKALVDDIAELKPTFFAGVPRIFDRIYSGVKAKVEGGGPIKKFLFNFGYGRKLDSLKRGKPVGKAAPIADLLVFGKVKERLGGRVRFIVSGGAPLAPHVEEFLRVAMCAPCVQGYGLTETCAGSFISIPDVMSQSGSVGPPVPSADARLESVADMNYDALGTPARGELCFKGPCLFSGYYKREDLTAEAFDADGWFHTGDIGEWQPDGSMKIIDRKKNIFKLAQGEYVAVENLENVYGLSGAVEQIWVYGNSFESSLVAVAVPVEQSLMVWAASNGVQGNFATVCQDPKARKYILDDLVSVGKKSKLKGFELIRAVYLEPAAFDLERDLLTPTFKKKRPQLLKCYQKEVTEMYDTIKAAEASKDKKH